eukprot:SAG11_NODE_4045_length_2088_cov_2.278029_1_plen_40_part_00
MVKWYLVLFIIGFSQSGARKEVHAQIGGEYWGTLSLFIK